MQQEEYAQQQQLERKDEQMENMERENKGRSQQVAELNW